MSRNSTNGHHYSTFHLLIDVLLTLVTGGLWLIVVLFQYLNRNR